MLAEAEFRARVEGQWQKSSFSGSSGSCVYIAVAEDTVGIVEIDDPAHVDSAAIVLTPLENFRRFLAGAKAGEFDL
ncbi:DUF397 domain-containing protein [Salinactinospora qingdaonensis]|uniref:DUF397 domain-containing protein n=1 Tax=Salinactinospora qingdaonensis TaxID=702744 RepID=A0ABP7EVK8_9ACTN